MPEDYFGEGVAARYDESSAEMFDPAVVEPVVDFLVELAGDGAALELGIGTGRIALPLAQRGVRVHGIDLSEAMVAELRAKPGGEEIGVTIGDFSTTTVEGMFSVAYLVFNTINNLTTQDEQVACFQNVAAHLEPGGCFVIEVGVPGLRVIPPGERFHVFDFSESHLASTSTTWPIRASSRTTSGPSAGGSKGVSIPPLRVAGGADLMARLAGMKLRERWSGWKREPFTSESTKHVSVWEKPADGPAGIAESTLRLSVPPKGLRAGDVVLRFPLPSMTSTRCCPRSPIRSREAGNLPAFGREELIASLRDLPTLAEAGRLLALAAVDAQTGEVVGGGTLHHLDAERRMSRSVTSCSRMPVAGASRRRRAPARGARFSLGIERVAAYVNVGIRRRRAWPTARASHARASSARCQNRMDDASTRRFTRCFRASDWSDPAPRWLHVGRPEHRVQKQPDEREDQHDDRPSCLCAATQVVAAEDVDHRADPHDEEERYRSNDENSHDHGRTLTAPRRCPVRGGIRQAGRRPR